MMMIANLSNSALYRKKQWMDHALDLARKAAEMNEVPVGAIIVGPDNRLLSEGYNETLLGNDPTAHAEILAIRRACEVIRNQRLSDCDLYVTLEPCAMCAAAISFARIRRLYFAASDPKGGAVEHGTRFFSASTCHHTPEIYGGIGEREAAALLTTFFTSKR